MIAKTLLQSLHVDQSDDHLEPAMRLCAATGMHLSVAVFGIAPPPPMAVEGIGLPDGWGAQMEQGRADVSTRAERAESFLQQRNVSGDVRTVFCELGQVDGAVGLQARFADLAWYRRGASDIADFDSAIAHGILFSSGKPMLVVNDQSPGDLAFKTVVVAWDGGLPASRAVSEAMALLAAADTVHVLCIDPDATEGGAGEAPGWDLANYLARHGARVTVDAVPSGGQSVASTIERHARDVGADLIVMGAYGRSRFRQRLFGGTTRSMLDSCSVPLLMAH